MFCRLTFFLVPVDISGIYLRSLSNLRCNSEFNNSWRQLSLGLLILFFYKSSCPDDLLWNGTYRTFVRHVILRPCGFRGLLFVLDLGTSMGQTAGRTDGRDAIRNGATSRGRISDRTPATAREAGCSSVSARLGLIGIFSRRLQMKVGVASHWPTVILTQGQYYRALSGVHTSAAIRKKVSCLLFSKCVSNARDIREIWISGKLWARDEFT